MAQNAFTGAVVIIVIGVAMAGFGGYNYQQTQSDLNNAVEAEGSIENVDITRDVTRRDRDDDGIKEEEVSWTPNVEYTYTYQGQQYTSDSIRPGVAGESFDSRPAAVDVTEQFSAGQSVTVYVNSEEPSRAFLIKDSSFLLEYAFMGIGGLAVLLGLYKAATAG
jgi:hypothetical protein